MICLAEITIDWTLNVSSIVTMAGFCATMVGLFYRGYAEFKEALTKVYELERETLQVRGKIDAIELKTRTLPAIEEKVDKVAVLQQQMADFISRNGLLEERVAFIERLLMKKERIEV